jgi:predicted HicB family RNase H-like nuclease
MNDLGNTFDKYTLRIKPCVESPGEYEATYVELGLSVTGFGDTPEEAIQDLRETAAAALEDEDPSTVPDPRGEAPWSDYSGRVTLRVPRSLHADMDAAAKEQGVSLNAYMTNALQAVTTAVQAGLGFGPLMPDSHKRMQSNLSDASRVNRNVSELRDRRRFAVSEQTSWSELRDTLNALTETNKPGLKTEEGCEVLDISRVVKNAAVKEYRGS